MPQDLYVELDQSACDKLLNSVKYPLPVLEQSRPFPGCPNLASVAAGYHALSDDEVDKLFTDSLDIVLGKKKRGGSPEVAHQIVSFGGSVIEQAKRVLDAAQSKEYEGPNPKELKQLVDDGIPGLPRNLRKILGDFGIYAWCPYLKVVLKTKLKIGLNSPRTDINGLKVAATATGELWVKYPWFNCYQWCLKWVKVEKCDRLASATVTLDVAADGHLLFSNQGTEIVAKPVFDKLRLDYPILDKIPLEDVANYALRNEEIAIFDASTLMTTIPIFNTRFQVDTLTLPNKKGGVGISGTIKQI
jgi:hypothetical protein